MFKIDADGLHCRILVFHKADQAGAPAEGFNAHTASPGKQVQPGGSQGVGGDNIEHRCLDLGHDRPCSPSGNRLEVKTLGFPPDHR